MDRWLRRSLGHLAMLGALTLAGCNALPASGPDERHVLDSERSKANQLGFHIVDINPHTTAVLATETGSQVTMLTSMNKSGPADRIGVGDILSISVFEIGSGLFSSNGAAASQAGAAGLSTSATRENLPSIQVGRDGTISFPYIGRIRVTGLTIAELQDDIDARLRSHSQNPQAVVGIKHNIANTVIVSGDVKKPGRVDLTPAHERLTDVIALAGGPAHEPQDILVDLIRHGTKAEARLDQIEGNFGIDVPIQPQDRVQLIYKPRSFTLFGATKVAEMPFTSARVSLAESLARAGGPLDERADPNAVFLFRFEAARTARELGVSSSAAAVPIIYRLDMMNTNSYFLAQQIPVRDKDVIYIANARTDQFGKFLGLLSGLFTPAIVARTLQQ